MKLKMNTFDYFYFFGKTWSYDFKKIKSIKRGTPPNEDVEWLEFDNGSLYHNNGGWLYGKEDFVVFEQSNSYIVVKRTALLTYALEKTQNQQQLIQMPDNANEIQFFVKYHRRGKRDSLVLVPTSDIKQIASKIIEKRELYTRLPKNSHNFL